MAGTPSSQPHSILHLHLFLPWAHSVWLDPARSAVPEERMCRGVLRFGGRRWCEESKLMLWKGWQQKQKTPSCRRTINWGIQRWCDTYQTVTFTLISKVQLMSASIRTRSFFTKAAWQGCFPWICPHLHFSILNKQRTVRRKQIIMPCPTILRPWGFTVPVVHHKETQHQLLHGRDHQSHALSGSGSCLLDKVISPPVTALSLQPLTAAVTCHLSPKAVIAQPVDAWCKQIFQAENSAIGTL